MLRVFTTLHFVDIYVLFYFYAHIVAVSDSDDDCGCGDWRRCTRTFETDGVDQLQVARKT